MKRRSGRGSEIRRNCIRRISFGQARAHFELEIPRSEGFLACAVPYVYVVIL